jgi:hypothetical protein
MHRRKSLLYLSWRNEGSRTFANVRQPMNWLLKRWKEKSFSPSSLDERSRMFANVRTNSKLTPKEMERKKSLLYLSWRMFANVRTNSKLTLKEIERSEYLLYLCWRMFANVRELSPTKKLTLEEIERRKPLLHLSRRVFANVRERSQKVNWLTMWCTEESLSSISLEETNVPERSRTFANQWTDS